LPLSFGVEFTGGLAVLADESATLSLRSTENGLQLFPARDGYRPRENKIAA
jgi:hypothetical protein